MPSFQLKSSYPSLAPSASFFAGQMGPRPLESLFSPSCTWSHITLFPHNLLSYNPLHYVGKKVTLVCSGREHQTWDVQSWGFQPGFSSALEHPQWAHETLEIFQSIQRSMLVTLIFFFKYKMLELEDSLETMSSILLITDDETEAQRGV